MTLRWICGCVRSLCVDTFVSLQGMNKWCHEIFYVNKRHSGFLSGEISMIYLTPPPKKKTSQKTNEFNLANKLPGEREVI